MIRKEDVIKMIEEWLERLDEDEEAIECVLLMLKNRVENMPEAVVRGEWVQKIDFDEDNNAIFECTNCLHVDVQAKGVEVPYCWFCGAGMRGKKK